LVIAAIVDYGIGNLFSIKNALEKLELTAKLVTSLRDAEQADMIIFPGVGNFTSISEKLLIEKQIFNDIVQSGKPILGICLGLQVLMDSSEEGKGIGLSRFPGIVEKLPNHVKVPHMGWNTLTVNLSHEFVDGISQDSWVYFVHSYVPKLKDLSTVLAETDYGVRFPSIIGDKTTVGTQFHPEKSGEIGNRLLKNFIKMAKR